MTELSAAAPRAAPAAVPRPAPRSWVLWALAVAGAGVVTGSLVLTLASDELDQRGLRAFLIAWIVVPYAVGGLVGWWRRPASRVGPLMLVTALVMALTSLQGSSQPLVHSLGHLLDMLPTALFLHLFLAFPSGRLGDRAERLVVGGAYVMALALQLGKVVLGADPESVFTLVPRPRAAGLLEEVQLGVGAALLLAGVVLLHLRRRRSGRSFRRPAALVVDAFGLALVLLAALLVANLGGWPATTTIRHLTFASLGLAPVAFICALLDERLARGAVAGLVIDLRDDVPGGLQAALARALRDPALQLGYWLPEVGSWADQDGRPMAPLTPDERHAVRVVTGEDGPLAALRFHRDLEAEPEILDAVAAAAGIALENGRLRADLAARSRELTGSRVRLLEAGRRERQRLERDLHDGAQQRLVALSLELRLLEDEAGTDPDLHDRLATARRELAASLEELRDLARGLYPAVLSGHGLAVALESVAARACVPTRLEVDLDGRLAEPVEAAAYYVVTEALTNLGKHARARSARVQVHQEGSRVVLDVVDDGVGGADPDAGGGLRGLADRVEALGGDLWITSPHAAGTRVHAEIPCP